MSNYFKQVINKINKVFKYFKSRKKLVFILVVAVLISLFILDEWWYNKNLPKEVGYLEFQDDLKGGKIDTVYYNPSEDTMRYTLLNKDTKDMSKKERKDYKYNKSDWRLTSYPAGETFREDVLKYSSIEKKSFNPIIESALGILLPLLIPIIIIVLVFKILMGKSSKTEASIIKDTKVGFSDVIGHDEVINDLKFIVDLMKNPEKGKNLNVKVPRGILFTGEPGTGKTLLAKSIAGEAGVTFLYMDASRFIELYVGTGAKRVRELFKVARKNSPCIIFIDEIDAIGGKRNTVGSNSEDTQTINALLTEMDGFNSSDGIFIIGATNNADILDKALVRAGRFDRQVVIMPPKDWTVRSKLFQHYIGDTKVSDDFDIVHISKQTTGFTGADIKSIVNEAKLIAVMDNSNEIKTDYIEEAIDKRIFKGNRSRKKRYDEDTLIIAYHESGHAVLSYLLDKPIARASIIGTTSGVGGMVMQAEDRSQFNTKKDIESQVMIAYGGRCSEKIKFTSITTGAVNDISSATSLIQRYILKYGFLDSFGMLDIEILGENRVLSNTDVLSLMSDLAKSLEKRALDLLNENYSMVEKLASKLLELETLSGDAIKELFSESDD